MEKSGGGLEIRSVDGEVREGRWGREGAGPLELPSYSSLCSAVPCCCWSTVRDGKSGRVHARIARQRPIARLEARPDRL